MAAFKSLIDGKYPAQLGKALRNLPDNAARLQAISERMAALDESPDDQLPFEKRILGAIEKDLRSFAPRDFLSHNENVFTLIGVIFDNLNALENQAPGISRGLKRAGDPLARRLRLAAFLHDTGKALEQSRHPILGWHVLLDLASVGTSDRKARDVLLNHLRKFINPSRPEAEYRWLARLVRDHDKFGVISTGEASYMILRSLMRYRRDGAEASLLQLRDTWLLNLADIGGTTAAQPTSEELRSLPPLLKALRIRRDAFEALSSDWNVVYEIISGQTFPSIVERLREASQIPAYTVTRIRRLLLARSKTWSTLADYFTEDLVEDALETHFAPRDLLAFCNELGMIAKLDYALQFWNEVADYLYVRLVLDDDVSKRIYTMLTERKTRNSLGEGTLGDWMRAYGEYNAPSNKVPDKSPWIGLVAELVRRAPLIRALLIDRAKANSQEEHIARNQADLLIAILRRVVVAYRGLIRGSTVSETAAIGVGFSYLRSDDREKRLALYELLTGGGDGRERGLRWLIDEIASWDMLA